MISLADAIKRVCTETHVPMAQDVFGREGVEAIFQIMETAQALYRHVELERVTGDIVIYKVVQPLSEHAAALVEPAVDFPSLANAEIDTLVLEIAVDGRAYKRDSEQLGLATVSERAVVYRYTPWRETFAAGTQEKEVIRLDSAARSQFAIPTLSNLREALQKYGSESVRESTCYILSDAWFDVKRLFLRASPETIIRDSLTQFLRNRIGGEHDVWPEQNVDESHPVDIRVQPRLSNNRLMLIEIKWLGMSAAANGHITARHGEPRAQSGADQLAQYLDDQRHFAPNNVVHGYYVILDARRKNLKEGAQAISREDGMHYENTDLQFDPAYHLTRKDFDPPYRMFARPVCD
jgi:hypothetical protein